MIRLIFILVMFNSVANAQSFAIFQARGTLPSLYEGIIATRGFANLAPNTPDTTNKQIMNKSTHVARDDVSSLKVLLSNFFVRGSSDRLEAGIGAASAVTASIEYPSGTCTQLLFSGSASGTIADGSTLTSDSLTVSIPNGATFFLRQYQTNTAGVIYSSINLMATDVMRIGVSGVADQTVSCGAISQAGSGMTLPLAIVSMTRKPSLCILGDSIAYGSDGSSGDVGIIAPSIGPTFGYSNVSIVGDEAFAFLASNTQRKKIIPYCSHGIVEYGTNDFAAGRTLAQLKADLASIYALFPTQPVFQTTILPRPATTDGCSTLGNQTVPSWEASRTSLNDQLRAATFGPNTGTFDTANIVETSLNSGKWKVSPSLWADSLCIHPSTFGYGQVTSSSVIDTSRIHRP